MIQRHQVKSKWYYYFWGTCTVAVVAGQMYVGVGYRQLAEAVWNLIDTVSIIREASEDGSSS
tara:strand:+ start:4497 stop:4682 length:186 start_codon:yes stop_codon:yes gene_type:complete